jgi:hypothetical protein
MIHLFIPQAYENLVHYLAGAALVLLGIIGKFTFTNFFLSLQTPSIDFRPQGFRTTF